MLAAAGVRGQALDHVLLRAQLPVFVTSVWAIRRMCAAEWPGLADGGILWFCDLTLPALDVSTMTAPMGR